VSRFHAYLTATSDGRVLLKDGNREVREASSNGTFVNSNCTRIDASG
jgi:pSer/pThr/pTyr-binding forkhead associated (FHA) protein